MRNKLLIIILLSTLPNSIWGQSYRELKVTADSLFNSQDYIQSAELYHKIISDTGGTSEIFYNASLSWASAGNIDNALSALDSAFLYGYDDLNTIEREEKFNILRKRLKYKELISRERQFYSVEVINNKWLISALNERKGLTLDNTKWEWEWEWEEIGGWNPIETYPELDLKFTADSLYDFSEKTLTIYNSKSKDITLSNLKLKSLNINNRSQKTRDIEVVDITRIELLEDYSTLKLNNLNVEKLELNISNTNFVRLEDMSIDKIDIKQVDSTDLIYFNKITINEGNLGTYGTLNKPIKFIYFENLIVGMSNKDLITFPFLIHCELLIIHQSHFLNEIDFGASNVKQLRLVKNEFNKKIVIDETNFFNEQNYLPYDQFIDGFTIGIYRNLRWQKYLRLDQDQALLVPERYVVNKEFYDRLVQVYKRMHSVYREQGDIISANSLYVDLKDLMIGRSLYKYYSIFYDLETNIFPWNWDPIIFELASQILIDLLLRWYTINGTNPARAIILSFWIILSFSIVYIFYPSEWDDNRNKRLKESFSLLIAKEGKGYSEHLFAVISNSLIILLNALALSLNAFVTLGFGSIPIKGFGKYFCILQGFIGWFLLSIFTVTLINQILI